MLPAVVVEAAIAAELDGTRAWAKRYGLDLAWNSAERILRVTLVQANTQEPFFLQGQFDNYKALPPIWDWRDGTWSNPSTLPASPKPGTTPFGSPMFICHNNKAIICAPFNLLAYGTHGGPHSNWGDPAQWMTAGGNYVRATIIGDMLQAILRDFRFTAGHMA